MVAAAPALVLTRALLLSGRPAVGAPALGRSAQRILAPSSRAQALRVVAAQKVGPGRCWERCIRRCPVGTRVGQLQRCSAIAYPSLLHCRQGDDGDKGFQTNLLVSGFTRR